MLADVRSERGRSLGTVGRLFGMDSQAIDCMLALSVLGCCAAADAALGFRRYDIASRAAAVLEAMQLSLWLPHGPALCRELAANRTAGPAPPGSESAVQV